MNFKAIVLAAVLGVTGAQAQAKTYEAAGAAFPVQPDSIRVTGPATLTTAASVARDEAIATLPFIYSNLVVLKAPIKGEFVGLEFLPAGTIGFDGGSFEWEKHLWCYFGDYAHPTCVGGHPARKERVTQVIVSSNVPLSYIYTTNMSSIYRMPENEPYTGAPLPHDFKMQLSVRSWSRDHVHVAWLSDGTVVLDKDFALDPDGAVRFRLDASVVVLKPDPQDKKRTLVSVESAPQ